MKETSVYDGSTSEAFDIRNGVKQGFVLVPTLFGCFFAVMLKHAFGTATEGIYLRTRSDLKLFNISILKTRTRVREMCLRDVLFADDAAQQSQPTLRMSSSSSCSATPSHAKISGLLIACKRPR